jgi:phospholipase/lecithinase/hemolysin
VRRPFLLTAVLLLCWSAAADAGPIRIGVVGDSLSDPYSRYPQFWGALGDKNWTEILQTARGGSVHFANYAMAGAESTDIHDFGQVQRLAADIKAGKVDYAVVMVGANDILDYVKAGMGKNPTAMLLALDANVKKALDTLQHAGNVKLVVSIIPDLSLTPSLQKLLGNVPGALAAVAGLIKTANLEIATEAAAHKAPVVDFFGLSHLATGPLQIGGVTVPAGKLFAPDGFHPSTVAQGLLANTILQTLQNAYGANISGLKLSDGDILTLAHIPHPIPSKASFFDISKFAGKGSRTGGGVVSNAVVSPAIGPATTPEPSALALGLCGVAGAVAWRRRSWRR